LLTALAAALAQLPKVKLARKPRMADFALFGVAVERGLGWPPGTFIDAYEANRSTSISSVIEASPVALAVQTFLEENREFEGTYPELLSELCLLADEQTKKHRSWPDTGWKLSGVLRRLAPSLRAGGMTITFGERKPDRKRTRVIRVAKTASDASSPSSVAEIQPILRTHTGATESPSDRVSQLRPFSNAASACVADPPVAADAPLQTARLVRGEI